MLAGSDLPIVVITVNEYRRAPEKFHTLSERGEGVREEEVAD